MSLRKMQSALPDLIGRTIKHIVVSEHVDHHMQVFLYFTDGTYYEFYGNWIDGIRHLSHGGLEISRGCGVNTGARNAGGAERELDTGHRASRAARRLLIDHFAHGAGIAERPARTSSPSCPGFHTFAFRWEP